MHNWKISYCTAEGTLVINSTTIRSGIKMRCNTILPNTLPNKLYTFSRLLVFVKLQMVAIYQRETMNCASFIFNTCGTLLCSFTTHLLNPTGDKPHVC